MDCKYCGQPLDEQTLLCPACGKDNAPSEDESVTRSLSAEEEAIEETAEEATEETAGQDAAALAPDDGPCEDTACADETDEAAQPDAPEEQPDATPTDKRKVSDALLTPTKKPGLIIAICVAAALLLGLVIYFIITGINRNGSADAETTAAQTTEDLSAPVAPSDDITVKSAYTKSGITPGDADMSKVFAQCGGSELTAGEFQIYYWMQVNEFMNEYGSYISMFGLDTTLPLSEQPCTVAEGLTWEQFFIQSAVEKYQEYTAVYADSKAQGFEMDEDFTSFLQTLPASLEQDAVTAGYSTAQDYLQTVFGLGVSMEDYCHYVEVYYTTGYYENELYEGLSYTEDDISAYYDENAQSYAEQGIEKADIYNVNVRHILIQPEDADGDGTSTDEEKAAAKKKADELYALYLADPTEENFAALANENSDDPGSNTAGGLYEDVYPGQMTAEFNDWCFAEGRQPGDTDIVETTHGYHIMYYVETTDTLYWYVTAENNYLSAQMEALIAEISGRYPLTVDYASLVLAELPAPKEAAG